MLKITIHSSDEAVTFQVEGKLVGAWAAELEQAWNKESSARNRKAFIVDLTETLYIDDEGKRVLATLFRDGAFFKTSGTMTSCIVDEITGKPRTKRHRMLTQSLLLLLVAAGIARSASEPAPLRLTLLDAVQMALKQNPQVQIANLNIAESQRKSKLRAVRLVAADQFRGVRVRPSREPRGRLRLQSPRVSRPRRTLLADSGRPIRFVAAV